MLEALLQIDSPRVGYRVQAIVLFKRFDQAIGFKARQIAHRHGMRLTVIGFATKPLARLDPIVVRATKQE